MKIVKVKVPLYKNKVTFAITPDQEEAKVYFKKNGVNVSNWPETASAMTWTKEGYYVFCYLPGLRSPDHLSMVCHELIHVAWHMLQDVGVTIAHDNHEALTYLVSYLSRELLKSK